MTTHEIHRNNGTDRLVVSANSPVTDVLDHWAATTTSRTQLLEDLVNLRGFLEFAIEDAVTDARAEGYSWEGIASALGVSRQAAHQRYAG